MLKPPLEPMLALAQDDIPRGAGWVYEPKWDGFRALVFRDGPSLELMSRKGQPLARYFPEVVERLRVVLPPSCVLDGELIIAGPAGLDFSALQSRLHPAASRVARLSKELPAQVVLFDCLELVGRELIDEPLEARRRALLSIIPGGGEVFVTPQTNDPDEAARWFVAFEGAGLDGVIAKRVELPYRPGERVMVKVKHGRTVDCVVGGFRTGKAPGVASLLLGLYDEAGVLHHVGHTSSFNAAERRALLTRLTPLAGGESFGRGRTPGAPSRWSQGKELDWTSVRPELVCEVRFDYMQGDRFRHAATFLRWREDKAPRACTYDQLTPPNPFALSQVIALADAARDRGV